MKVLNKAGEIVKDVIYQYNIGDQFTVYENIKNEKYINVVDHPNYKSAMQDRNSRLFINI